MRPWIKELLTVRHGAFELTKTPFDASVPLEDQLYDDPAYEDTFVYDYDSDDMGGQGGDLNARRGKAFGEGEAYEAGVYTDEILTAAIQFDFVQDHQLAQPSAEIDRRIGIGDSELPSLGEVEAIVVPGAAGMSNVMRIRDAIRNIESGAIQTDTLFIATCERKVEEDERGRLEAFGFHGGTTELASTMIALNELMGTTITPDDAEVFPVELPSGTYDGKLAVAPLTIGGKHVDCVFVSTPFDPERRDKHDKVPVRANTDETFVAVNQLLENGAGTIVIESHDTWVPSQGVNAENVFGLAGKTIIATGPRRLDRVSSQTDKQGNQHLVLDKPEAVIDEIAKTYFFLAQSRINALNVLAELES